MSVGSTVAHTTTYNQGDIGCNDDYSVFVHCIGNGTVSKMNHPRGAFSHNAIASLQLRLPQQKLHGRLAIVIRHFPLIPLLIIRRPLIPSSSLMLRKGFELPRDDLRNFSKLGVWVPSFHIVPDVIGKKEESALISLGGIGILLLLLFPLSAVVRIVIGRGRVTFHFTGVAFLILLGEFLPFGGFFGLERFELRGEDFGLRG